MFPLNGSLHPVRVIQLAPDLCDSLGYELLDSPWWFVFGEHRLVPSSACCCCSRLSSLVWIQCSQSWCTGCTLCSRGFCCEEEKERRFMIKTPSNQVWRLWQAWTGNFETSKLYASSFVPFFCPWWSGNNLGTYVIFPPLLSIMITGTTIKAHHSRPIERDRAKANMGQFD